MARVNRAINHMPSQTHEGGRAYNISDEACLRRSVMACMLWENEFYESGESIAQRIAFFVPKVAPHIVSQIAIEARTKMNLRHVPLLIVSEMARHETHRPHVRFTLASVIQRADELAEFMAIYWRKAGADTKPSWLKKAIAYVVGDKKYRKIAKSVQKGLADAFPRFSEYDLAKYNRSDASVKLRDVLFIAHPQAKDAAQQEMWDRLVKGELKTPDTWEVAISAAKGNPEQTHLEWTRLLMEKRLGALALLRNLRNMTEANVDHKLVREALRGMSAQKVLPFRFLAALRHAPQYAMELEAGMLKNVAGMPKIPGHTVILVDVSGSMDYQLSEKSDMHRVDAACGLAILAREMCESCTVWTFSGRVVEVPAYRGLALQEAILNSQPHSSTALGMAIRHINNGPGYDRLVVITDEQSHDTVGPPRGKGYVINVASAQNGVGYGPWIHIDGWSDQVFTYIHEHEAVEDANVAF